MKRHTILTVAVALTLGTAASALAESVRESDSRMSVPAVLQGISVERLHDRVRVTIDGIQSSNMYQVEDSRIPPMVAVSLNGTETGASGELRVDQPPVRRVIRDQIASAGHGSRVVFQLTDYVVPEITRTERGLQVDFPAARGAAATASTITGIRMHPLAEETAVMVSADGQLEFDAHMASGNRLVVDLPGVSTPLTSPFRRKRAPWWSAFVWAAMRTSCVSCWICPAPATMWWSPRHRD